MIITETEKKIKLGLKKLQAITGFVNDSGDIIASDELSRHDDVWSYGQGYDISRTDTRWRCHYDDSIVRWWENIPTDKQRFVVEEFLKYEYNVTVKRHVLYGQSQPEDFGENKLMEEIKQLIKEGVKEKALEDFISKTIRGTEWQGKVFIAGGYVRDEFMGKDPKDLDLLVNSPNGGIEFAKWITKKVGAYRGNDIPIPPEPQPPTERHHNYHGGAAPGEREEAEAQDAAEYQTYRQAHDAWEKQITAIEQKSGGSNPVIFPRFGTAKFNLRGVVHNGIDLSDMDIEAVMPRKEQYTAGSRKPTVTGGELKDDVERRDFTVNSLLKDLSTGEILDLTGMGKADIQAGIVRTPLNPDKIFTDDPLRMLRAIRFAVKYQWKLPMFMLRGLKKNASQLQNISQERVRDELNKMLVTGHPSKAIKLMKVTGLLPFVIPELLPAVRMVQNKHHKADVFQHTLDVLGKTEPVLVQRLMGLFHDIGKTVTRSVEPDTGGVHFYGHELEGEKMVEEIMARLKYPRELIDAVKLGVRNHMRLKQAGDVGVKLKDKTLLKFRNEMGEQLENVLNLMHADNIAHSEASSMPHQIAGIRKRLETLKDVPTKPKMPISGFDLQKMGLKPGPLFKEIISAVTEAWYENPGLTKEQAIEIAKRVAKV
jgi:poly(A) polymerase